MNKIEPCSGCGRIILVHPVANLVVRLDTEPLDAKGAADALIAGRGLWRVTQTSVTGVRPAELSALAARGVTEGPQVVQEHRCPAGSAPLSRSGYSGAATAPKGPEKPAQRLAGRPTPSSARPTAHSGARNAVQRPSSGPREAPRCSACSGPCEDGTYASVELGDLVLWAMHVERCTG